jgi:hypothetical protein
MVQKVFKGNAGHQQARKRNSTSGVDLSNIGDADKRERTSGVMLCVMRNKRRENMKKVILTVFCVLLSGCGKTTSVDAVIVKIVDDKSNMGCVGTDKRTVFRTVAGNVSHLCGEYGREGDKIRGYWTEGALGNADNGFSLIK